VDQHVVVAVQGAHAALLHVQLRLALFGSFSVTICQAGKGARALPLAGRPGGLLALLALAGGRFFSRAELARELWSGSPDAGSAGSFNTLLWRLRKSLEATQAAAGDLIECDRQGALRLASHVQVTTDIDEYRVLVEAPLAKPVEQLSPADIEQLRQAVQLYQGDVLASFQDDWALRLRERHRRLQLGALARLMHLATLAHAWPEAIHHGEAMLEIDELREDVCREVMRCHLAAGQRALALRQFERCRAALKNELAIQPMRETLTLYQEIADAATAQPAAAVPRPAAPAREAAAPVPDRRATPERRAGPGLLQSIAQARWHLSQADAHLQLQLPFAG
jgi:DNA-binding SARP family transcriptional activator